MEIGKLVSQQDEWGCGAACVASLLGISYADAKLRLEAHKGADINARPKGLEPLPITKVLEDVGYKVNRRYKASTWPLGTIVLLTWKFGRYKNSGHYMLLTGHGWMDPWFNLKEKPRTSKYRASLPKNTAVACAIVVQRS